MSRKADAKLFEDEYRHARHANASQNYARYTGNSTQSVVDYAHSDRFMNSQDGNNINAHSTRNMETNDDHMESEYLEW